jgi:molybdate transport system substrate-binding protein
MRSGAKVAALASVLAVVIAFVACGSEAGEEASGGGGTLELFVGSATKPATEEAAQLFEEKYGVDVDLHFGGSGAMLSQMELTERGDIYFPGSSDFMEEANPKDIRGLEDLARPDLKVAIADPETVCVGLYAVEVLEKSGLADAVRPNIVTYTESCAKTARVVALGNVDAVIGWRVFQYWAPEEVETVYLEPEQVPRIGYVPIAVSTFSKQPALAQRFIDFIVSEEAQDIYRDWSYLTICLSLCSPGRSWASSPPTSRSSS